MSEEMIFKWLVWRNLKDGQVCEALAGPCLKLKMFWLYCVGVVLQNMHVRKSAKTSSQFTTTHQIFSFEAEFGSLVFGNFLKNGTKLT